MISSSHRPSARPLLRELRETALVVVAGLAVASGLHAVLYQPFTIPSASMEPGLVEGDYIVTSKFAYGWSRASLPISLPLPQGRVFGRDPARGDVVVFRLPRNPRETWIKRVIGLPGDRVQVRGGHVIVNGVPIARRALGSGQSEALPGAPVQRVRESLPDGRTWTTFDLGPGPGDETPVIEVPHGHYMVMGDSRDNSLDGRFPAEVGVGLLPDTNLLGRAEVIVASWKPGASLWKPWTWFRLRNGRTFKPID